MESEKENEAENVEFVISFARVMISTLIFQQYFCLESECFLEKAIGSKTFMDLAVYSGDLYRKAHILF